MNNSSYVYFLYSDEQFKEKNEILSKVGKSFSPGTVIVNGTRKKYTQLSTTQTISRFIDSKVVAEGVLSSFTYTSPSNSKKGSA
jgi:hypothetical protein